MKMLRLKYLCLFNSPLKSKQHGTNIDGWRCKMQRLLQDEGTGRQIFCLFPFRSGVSRLRFCHQEWDIFYFFSWFSVRKSTGSDDIALQIGTFEASLRSCSWMDEAFQTECWGCCANLRLDSLFSDLRCRNESIDPVWSLHWSMCFPHMLEKHSSWRRQVD